MPMVTIRERGQITIPREIREALHLQVGDMLEAIFQQGRLVLQVKAVVNRSRETLDDMLEESLAQAERGETTGPITVEQWREYVKSIERPQ